LFFNQAGLPLSYARLAIQNSIPLFNFPKWSNLEILTLGLFSNLVDCAKIVLSKSAHSKWIHTEKCYCSLLFQCYRSEYFVIGLRTTFEAVSLNSWLKTSVVLAQLFYKCYCCHLHVRHCQQMCRFIVSMYFYHE